MPSLEEIANWPDEDLYDGGDPDIDPDAAIVTYTDIVGRYGNKEGLKVGDIVTPRKGYHLNKAGVPCVVVEIADPPLKIGHPDPSHPSYEPRLDVRIIRVTAKGVYTMWYESWQLERWQRKR